MLYQFGLFLGRTGIFLGLESTFGAAFVWGLFLLAAPNETVPAIFVDPFWIAALVLFEKLAPFPGFLPSAFFELVFGVDADLNTKIRCHV